jgi:hypothetical protein
MQIDCRRIRAFVSSGVAHVATHPGKSGEYAEKLSPAFSTIIRKRRIRGSFNCA